MDSYDACDKINSNVSYKPGWHITASPLSDTEIYLHLRAIVADSDRAQAPDYRAPILTSWETTVDVRDLDLTQVYGEVLRFILGQEIHEAREFFKVGNGYDAPFHPHTTEGMKNWTILPHHYETH